MGGAAEDVRASEGEAGAEDVLVLDRAPDLTPMLGKVALGALPVPGLGAGGGGSTLPATRVVLQGAVADPAHVAEYAEVCGFRVGSTLPITYLHMLGFPLSVKLMTRPDFPFGLLGLVHVRNRVVAHRPVGVDEVLELTASVEDLRPHPKGRQLDNVVVARVGTEVVWESTSTYLRRGGGGAEDGPVEESTGPADGVDVAALPLTARWAVPKDIGRRYGAVSGDRNPIHLTGLSAKAFGFPRAIAHGMWTKARCLAALEGRLPSACDVDVAFKLPVLLPSTVEYATEPRGEGWAFSVRARDGRPHLAGAVTTL